MAQTVMAWSELRDVCIEAFKEMPPYTLEPAIIDAFERSPEAVVRAVDNVSDRYRSGKIQKPWYILSLECRRGTDVVVAIGPNREKQVARAESHLRVAGLYLPSENEVREAYFGHGGLLNLWKGDSILEERILGLWRELQAVVDKDLAATRERDAAWLELGKPVLAKRWARVAA